MLELHGSDPATISLSGPPDASFGNYDAKLSGADPYCTWRWNGAILVAETDRYGFFPLFYCICEDGIMLSPSLVALIQAGAPTELDDAAIAVALRLWTFLGDDTPFGKIRVLPPGGKLTWTPGRQPIIERRFVFGQRVSMSRTAAIDGYIERFRAAIHRRADGTSVVPLSGGRDSRHIFLEMCSAGRAPDMAITVSGWNQQTPDAEIAAAVAERAGVRQVTVGLPASRWRAQVDTVSATHLCTFDHWWLENLILNLHNIGRPVSVFEGVAGDVLSSGLFKTALRAQLFEQGKLRELAEMMLGEDGYFKKVLPTAWYSRFSRDLAGERLHRELREHVNAPNPLASFLLFNRTRRVTALTPTTLLSPHAKVWCPYLDVDVWDFLTSLEPSMVGYESTSTFHDEAIHRAYPKFADIPFAHSFDAKRRLPSYDRRTIWEMAKGVAGVPATPLRKPFLWPRLIRGITDPSYTSAAAELTPIVSYLTTLATVGRL